MTPPLFLLDPLPAGERVSLDGAEGRHAARVKRLRPGEQVTLADGRGARAECTVDAVQPDGLSLTVRARSQDPQQRPRLVVAQALPKGERAELAVELMTELGVAEIVPWTAQRAEVRWRGDRADKALARWRRTAREATKQSRRSWVPAVTEPASTDEIAGRLAGTTGVVLHERAQTPLASCALAVLDELIVVVGPEGGVSGEELTRLTEAGAGAVHLGRPVLRTSTAGAAALAVLSTRLGHWG